MKTVVVLNSEQMGNGSTELGQKILATFLRKCLVLRGLTCIILYNGAVKLLAPDSPVVTELTQLHEAGVDIKPCGTCVEYYGLGGKLAVSPASNMDEILRELDAAEKVITL